MKRLLSFPPWTLLSGSAMSPRNSPACSKGLHATLTILNHLLLVFLCYYKIFTMWIKTKRSGDNIHCPVLFSWNFLLCVVSVVVREFLVGVLKWKYTYKIMSHSHTHRLRSDDYQLHWLTSSKKTTAEPDIYQGHRRLTLYAMDTFTHTVNLPALCVIVSKH